jgi:glycosyltransferase involved in cell wall biosynthesis
VSASPQPPPPAARGPLRVSVLVDLAWTPHAGGHVKVWERLAAAATRRPELLDLTVHVSGARDEEHALAGNVRFRVHPPVFSSRRLGFLADVPDHSDLSPHHPGLARQLRAAEVLHTTDAYFAFARTAERIARRRRIPLVSSVHTDTPRMSALYTAATVRRLLGRGWAARLLLERWRVAEAVHRRMAGRLVEHQRRSAYALVARPEQLVQLAPVLPRARTGLLRRGVDHAGFSPAHRDRAWLEQRFAIPPGGVVVLYAGRLDLGKNVLTLADAVAALAGEGWPVHLVCAGDGPERAAVHDRLGARGRCPGVLDGAELARAYASADLFAQPSEIEECSNVVLEALSSGLPVAVAERGGSGRLLEEGTTGVIVRGDGARAWVEALRALAGDPRGRAEMGRAARAYAQRSIPSWAEVLERDLLPVWQRAAGEGRA